VAPRAPLSQPTFPFPRYQPCPEQAAQPGAAALAGAPAEPERK